MAVVAISNDFSRLDAMDTNVNIFSVGGGAGAGIEPDFRFQGTACISRKITSSTGAGFQTDAGGATFDATVSGKEVWISKFIATNKDALNSNGIRPILGTGLNDYYEFLVYDQTTYPKKGGWIVWPIDPSISGYRSATVGSPGALTAVDRWGIVGAFSASAKAENVGLDAIDHGTGLFIVGGDGANDDGVFDDFLSYDGQTIGNAYGVVTAPEAIPGVFSIVGKLYFGQTSAGTTTATVFTDDNKTVVFRDGFVNAGFFGMDFDLGNATTAITLTSVVFVSEGNTTTTDTRAVMIVTGTSGTLDILASTFTNFEGFDLTAGVTIDGCSFSQCNNITQNGAVISGNTITGATNGDGVAFIVSDNPANISDNEFTFSDGHAIEITTPGTYTFSGNKFNGYGSAGSTDAAIYNNSGGAVTLNIAGGGDTPTIRNGTGASTTVNNNTQVTLTGLPIGVEVRIYDDTGSAGSPVAGTEIDGIESTTLSTFSFSDGANNDVIIVIFDEDQIRDGGVYLQYKIPSSDAEIPFSLLTDRVYLNP